MGALFGIGDEDEGQANAYNRQALAQYEGLEGPQFAQYTPEMIDASGLDPESNAAQLEALRLMREGATAQGLTQSEQLAQQQAMDAAARQQRGQREAITAAMQRRGVGGSGAALAAQLANSQTDADANYNAGVGAIQSADNARSAALRDYGQAANQRYAQRAAIAGQNTQARNQGFQYNQGMQQQAFANRANIANARSGAYQNAAAGKQGKANQSRDQFGNIVNTAIQTGLGVARLVSDERAKEGIKPIKLDAVLSALEPKEFKYRGSKSPMVGVIAQQVEKIPGARHIVAEENGVKMIDGNKALSLTLAALGNLSRRIDQLEG